MTFEEEISALKGENAQQRERIALLGVQVAALLERVRELEARHSHNNHNNHKPPS